MCEDPNGSSEEATKMLSTVCALGGQDRSVSIWVTRFSEPLCVAADIFNNSIYDISWYAGDLALSLKPKLMFLFFLRQVSRWPNIVCLLSRWECGLLKA